MEGIILPFPTRKCPGIAGALSGFKADFGPLLGTSNSPARPRIF